MSPVFIFIRLALAAALLATIACDEGPVTQTVLRISASVDLDVPDGALVHLIAHRDGERQHEPGHDLGMHPYQPDTKLTLQANDNDGSRRFTVFAELLDEGGTRLSWARVRSGFVQGEIREIRIEFAEGCRNPSDQAAQPADYDPTFVCGSHDTCIVGASGTGACASACYDPEPYSEERGDVSSESVPCPEEDDLVVERLEMGWYYSCALSDSEAFCWGRIGREPQEEYWQRPSRIMNPNGRTTLGEGDTIHDLRASIHVACAITTNGEVRCGGNNLSDPPRYVAGVPIDGNQPCCTVAPPDMPPVVALDAHNSYTCVVTEADGQVWCSGHVPGDGDHDTFTPWEADGSPVGGFHTLYGGSYLLTGYTDDGFEWLATLSRFDDTTPMPREEDVVDVASTNDGLCMVTEDGTLLCWGNDVFDGRIGAQPANLGSTWRRIAIAASSQESTAGPHRCAIATDGTLWCWGDATSGKLGSDGGPRTFENRVQVGSASDWTEVGAGLVHTCGVRAGGHVVCWGANSGYQLGVEGWPRGLVRVPVPGW